MEEARKVEDLTFVPARIEQVKRITRVTWSHGKHGFLRLEARTEHVYVNVDIARAGAGE